MLSSTARRRAAIAMTGLASGVAVPVLFASPAEAHASTTYSGNGLDRASVNDSHVLITVCDTVADGHGVYAIYRTNTGRQAEVRDGNGSQAGCGGTVVPSGERIVEYKACTRDVVCSPFQPA